MSLLRRSRPRAFLRCLLVLFAPMEFVVGLWHSRSDLPSPSSLLKSMASCMRFSWLKRPLLHLLGRHLGKEQREVSMPSRHSRGLSLHHRSSSALMLLGLTVSKRNSMCLNGANLGWNPSSTAVLTTFRAACANSFRLQAFPGSDHHLERHLLPSNRGALAPIDSITVSPLLGLWFFSVFSSAVSLLLSGLLVLGLSVCSA